MFTFVDYYQERWEQGVERTVSYFVCYILHSYILRIFPIIIPLIRIIFQQILSSMGQSSNQVNAKQKQSSKARESRSIGAWSLDENLLYINFLDRHKGIFNSKKKRKTLRIFDQMSQFIGTRNSLQCRSHHQKLLEKMDDAKMIIKNFKRNVGKKHFNKLYRDCLSRKQAGLIEGGVKQESVCAKEENLEVQVKIEDQVPDEQIRDKRANPCIDLAYYYAFNSQILSNLMWMNFYSSS